MGKELDFRIQKTYKGLIEAFLSLLEEKRFEDIAVNELCERGMIRRATFYKHFADKYEFFLFFVRWISDDFKSKTLPKESYVKPRDFFLINCRSLITFLSENEKLVNSALRSNMIPALLDMISQSIALNMQTIFEEEKKQNNQFSLNPKIAAQLYTGALVHATKWWLTQNNKLSGEELLNQISLWLPNF